MHPLARVPASLFSMVLGLAGLGAAWRRAHHVWGLPAIVGEAVMLAATLVWLVVLVLYAAKWLLARGAALEEARHPVQSCFLGLGGVATMLVAGAVLPYSRALAEIIFMAGFAYATGFAVWHAGLAWQGEREDAHATPALYLPTVGGGFVTAIIGSALGFPGLAMLGFGAGALSWLAIESVVLRRLYNRPMLPAALRPSLGIQLGPPTVGLVAYLSITEGAPAAPAYALFGYGLLQALILLRMTRWIRVRTFIPSYWAFSFGGTAIALAPLLMIERGDSGPAALLAPWLFAGSNALIAILVWCTLRLGWRVHASMIIRCGPAIAMVLLALAGLALFGSLTRGFQAVTSDGVRRIDMERRARTLPAITLVDSGGRLFSLNDIGARNTLITLGYTTCVDICRTTASGQAYLQQELRARKLDEQVRLLTISFDPARDTPAALAAYARKMKADPARWTFATVADPADLPRLLKLFEIVVLPDGLGGFVHNGAIFLAGPDGRVVRTYDIDRPDQALADLLPD
jgi:tellurite resistance protein